LNAPILQLTRAVQVVAGRRIALRQLDLGSFCSSCFCRIAGAQETLSKKQKGTDLMSRTSLAAIAAFAGLAFVSTAEARPYNPTQSQGWQQTEGAEPTRRGTRQVARQHRYVQSVESAPRRSGVGPRPGRWCGWWMRTQKGGGPEYNLAWNWRNYGSPSGPQVGAVVVWRHHVGMIVGRASNGQWIVKSGNDGGAVRTRARSVAGAIFRV
jgi:hypothetical protein